MLFDALFGNANIEKVLFFLLVNEKCYAMQLSRCLRTALTPLQQALGRLEKGGIVASVLEGKTRFYRFNPHYPFLRELHALLKQGYQHLNLQEQQTYYCPQDRFPVKKVSATVRLPSDSMHFQEAMPLLWQRLLQVKHLSFSAQSKAEQPSGWNGIGKAKVEIHPVAARSVIFKEQGNWTSHEGKQFDFKNALRWTWHASKLVFILEHLHYGPEHPIVLFELKPISLTQFEVVQPFLCKQDTYLAHLYCDQHFIQLHWRVIGPKKNEEMHYIYT
jgi:hypothetical protein